MKPIPPYGRALDLDEVRLVADLRVMHAKVMELYQSVATLRARHSPEDVRKYADAELLAQNISHADEIYQFYVGLAEQSMGR